MKEREEKKKVEKQNSQVCSTFLAAVLTVSFNLCCSCFFIIIHKYKEIFYADSNFSFSYSIQHSPCSVIPNLVLSDKLIDVLLKEEEEEKDLEENG